MMLFVGYIVLVNFRWFWSLGRVVHVVVVVVVDDDEVKAEAVVRGRHSFNVDEDWRPRRSECTEPRCVQSIPVQYVSCRSLALSPSSSSAAAAASPAEYVN